jgi:hypothetical protein
MGERARPNIIVGIKDGDQAVKVTTTMGDGSVDDRFLQIWLSDPDLLRHEFEELFRADRKALPGRPVGP